MRLSPLLLASVCAFCIGFIAFGESSDHLGAATPDCSTADYVAKPDATTKDAETKNEEPVTAPDVSKVTTCTSDPIESIIDLQATCVDAGLAAQTVKASASAGGRTTKKYSWNDPTEGKVCPCKGATFDWVIEGNVDVKAKGIITYGGLLGTRTARVDVYGSGSSLGSVPGGGNASQVVSQAGGYCNAGATGTLSGSITAVPPNATLTWTLSNSGNNVVERRGGQPYQHANTAAERGDINGCDIEMILTNAVSGDITSKASGSVGLAITADGTVYAKAKCDGHFLNIVKKP